MSAQRLVGLALRASFLDQLLESRPALSCLELLADNYLRADRATWRKLEALRSHYPLTLHCVGMNIGSLDPLDGAYLDRISELSSRLAPISVSDHLCFTAIDGTTSHDLLPLAHTPEAVLHCA